MKLKSQHFNIGIITINFNTDGDTINLVESVNKSKVGYGHILCIIDNNSTETKSKSLLDYLNENIDLNYKELNLKINDQVNNECILRTTDEWIASNTNKLKVLLIKLDENIGFAAANNLGYNVLKNISSHFLIINNDVVVEKNLINELMNSFEGNEMCGLSTGKIYFGKPDNNVLWYAGGRFSFEPNIFNRHPYRGENDFNDEERQVTFASGALILTSNQIIKKFNLFHEAFFFGEEDAAFSYKLLRDNYKIIYNPKAKCWHNVGTSRKKISNNKWFNSKKNKSRFLLAALTAPFYAYYFWLLMYLNLRVIKYIISGERYDLIEDMKSLIYSLKIRYSKSFFENQQLINSSKYLSR